MIFWYYQRDIGSIEGCNNIIFPNDRGASVSAAQSKFFMLCKLSVHVKANKHRCVIYVERL
jgi:hypothetical protein